MFSQPPPHLGFLPVNTFVNVLDHSSQSQSQTPRCGLTSSGLSRTVSFLVLDPVCLCECSLVNAGAFSSHVILRTHVELIKLKL